MNEVPPIRRLLSLSDADSAVFSRTAAPQPIVLALVQPFFQPRPIPPNWRRAAFAPNAEEALKAVQLFARSIRLLTRAEYDANIQRLINGNAQPVGVLFDEHDRIEQNWAKLNHQTRFWTAVPTHELSGLPLEDETLVQTAEKLRVLGVGAAQVCGGVLDVEGVFDAIPSLGPVGFVLMSLWASRRLRTVTIGLQTTLTMKEGNKAG